MAAMGAQAGQPLQAAAAAVAATRAAGAAPLSAADRATIHYLAGVRWTIAQIADYSGQDRETIVQVLREPREPEPAQGPAQGPTPATEPAAPALRVRLSRDARRLQIRLPVEAVPAPTAVLLEQIRAECARLHLPVAPTAAELDQRLETCVYGAWRTVLEATPPTPPTPGRVRLLVRVPTLGHQTPGIPTVVRRGTILARRVPGRPGQPGRDLRGQPLPPRPPREATLPQGEHTLISADGTELVAACDGQVVLRHLRLHVRPTTLHEGDLTGDDGVLQASGAAIVTGAVREGGAVAAAGDVAIGRGVQTGRIASAGGSIVVEGAVAGTAARPSVLRAGRDITCGRVFHGTLHAEGDLILQGDAHHSTLEVGGTLYLPAALEECLFGVRLTVGGGVVVPVAPPPPSAAPALATARSAPTERRHTRVLVTLPARIARYGPPPFAFTPCVIEDLSPGGARCRLAAPGSAETLAPETLVQLKWELPDSPGQVIALARTVHTGAPDALGVAFLQISAHDADRVMQFCLEQMRASKMIRAGTRADRRPAS